MTTLRRYHHLAAILGYVFLTVIFTWPLATQMQTHVMGVNGARLDNYEYVWKMDYVADALISPNISPFFTPDIYYPFGYPLAYGEITPIHTFGLAPLTLLIGAVPAYNLAALASTVLSGWAMYALARRWINRIGSATEILRWLAAYFAGAAFAFSAYRMQKLTGHLPLFDTQWLVLTLLFFDMWLEQKKFTQAGLWGAFLALSTLSSWYYGFMLGLLLPVYALAWIGFPISMMLRFTFNRQTLIGVGIAGLIIGGLCVPFLIPYLQLSSEGATNVPLDDAAFWAASPTDYLMPNPLHPLWGSAVQRVMWPFPTPMLTEFVISIGWVTIFLALPALRGTRGRNWRGLKWMMLAAFVLSLGPILYFSRLPLGIPLPDMLLRELLPFADSIRSWGRFSIFVMLGFSLLASAGMVLILREKSARTQFAGAATMVCLMLFGAWIGPLTLTPVEPRAVDLWLAEQPEAAPIMEYPLSEALSGPAMYYTSIHHKPVVFGYGTYLPLVYRERHPELTTFPDDAALNELAAWGVKYILVSEWALDYDHSFTMGEIEAQPRLRRVIELDGVVVFELAD